MEPISIIRLIGKEFESVGDEELGYWTQLVEPLVSKSKFGNLYGQALAYMVCHKMKMAGLGESALGELGKVGNGFAISSASEGETSVSLTASSMATQGIDAEFYMTPYGLQFLMLRKRVIIPIRSSGEAEML